MTPIVTWYLLALCGLTGLALGSFLNVVVYRVPRHLSIVRPPSACPSCATPVVPRDNIPVVSWLLLRGRCRSCAQPISVRYPIVEAATAALFVLAGVRFGLSWTLPAELVFLAGLVALASCDQERFLLPKRIVYPTLVGTAGGLLLAAGVQGQWVRLATAAACGLAAFGLFAVIHFVNPKWMGFGDVRLAGLLGLGLGWLGPMYLVVAVIVANLIGAGLGVGLMVAGRATRKTPFPYGAFLALGAVSAVLLGAPVLHWYASRM